MTKLLYIHNKSVQESVSGSINTTLLQVVSMCKAFVNQGCNVTLVLDKTNETDDELRQKIENLVSYPVPFKIIGRRKYLKPNILGRLLAMVQIKKIVLKEVPDIVYTRDPLNLTPLLRLKTPVVYESHNATLSERFAVFDRLLNKLVITKAKNKYFKSLVTISQSLSDYWIKNNIPADKIVTYHDGFRSELYAHTLSKTEARYGLGLPVDKQTVVYTGGLYPDREIDQLVVLAKHNPAVLFLIIGGPKRFTDYYRTLAEKQKVDNVQFLGLKPHRQIPEYLYAADILVALWSEKSPIIKYCSPLKLFEYMAAGRVILTHDFPTIREVLDPNEDAIFAEPGNFDALNNSLKMALSASKDNILGKNARKKAFETYTWDKRAATILKHINR